MAVQGMVCEDAVQYVTSSVLLFFSRGYLNFELRALLRCDTFFSVEGIWSSVWGVSFFDIFGFLITVRLREQATSRIDGFGANPGQNAR